MGLQLVAIKAPIFQGSELIHDLSYFTGAKIVGDMFSEYDDLAKADPPYILGKLHSAKINSKESTFRGLPDYKDQIDNRINEL